MTKPTHLRAGIKCIRPGFIQPTEFAVACTLFASVKIRTAVSGNPTVTLLRSFDFAVWLPQSEVNGVQTNVLDKPFMRRDF